ncbi:hypothetical protein [Chroococcidiopsis sp. CCALA 051]|uniref:hypothetical protein n=1 Tax=Chroococcidiopsis sp. CCALA 051 TaxID=869949 RepID=UPI0018EBC0DA|nr:hypothetical protein [Chroococcidiopsis sp. CCALA 051]
MAANSLFATFTPIRAFLRLELYWFATGISWYEAKLAIIRDAIRTYLSAPRYSLHPIA